MRFLRLGFPPILKIPCWGQILGVLESPGLQLLAPLLLLLLLAAVLGRMGQRVETGREGKGANMRPMTQPGPTGPSPPCDMPT